MRLARLALALPLLMVRPAPMALLMQLYVVSLRLQRNTQHRKIQKKNIGKKQPKN
jgi:hypothetical protein